MAAASVVVRALQPLLAAVSFTLLFSRWSRAGARTASSCRRRSSGCRTRPSSSRADGRLPAEACASRSEPWPRHDALVPALIGVASLDRHAPRRLAIRGGEVPRELAKRARTSSSWGRSLFLPRLPPTLAAVRPGTEPVAERQANSRRRGAGRPRDGSRASRARLHRARDVPQPGPRDRASASAGSASVRQHLVSRRRLAPSLSAGCAILARLRRGASRGPLGEAALAPRSAARSTTPRLTRCGSTRAFPPRDTQKESRQAGRSRPDEVMAPLGKSPLLAAWRPSLSLSDRDRRLSATASGEDAPDVQEPQRFAGCG